MFALCAPTPFWMVQEDRRVVLSTPLSYYAFYYHGDLCLELLYDARAGHACDASRARYFSARDQASVYNLETSECRHLVWLPEDTLWESWDPLVPDHTMYGSLPNAEVTHSGLVEGWHVIGDRLWNPYHEMES